MLKKNNCKYCHKNIQSHIKLNKLCNKCLYLSYKTINLKQIFEKPIEKPIVIHFTKKL